MEPTRSNHPRSLDDTGSMCAALMRAKARQIGPDLKWMIDSCSDWVANKQFRLAGGPMARNIVAKGFALVVFDLDQRKIADLLAEGAQARATAAEVAAASDIVIGKSFDNGLLCSSPNSVVVDRGIDQELRRGLTEQGGHFLSAAEGEALARRCEPCRSWM